MHAWALELAIPYYVIRYLLLVMLSTVEDDIRYGFREIVDYHSSWHFLYSTLPAEE